MSEIDDSFPVSLDLIVTRKRMAAAGEDRLQRKLGEMGEIRDKG